MKHDLLSPSILGLVIAGLISVAGPVPAQVAGETKTIGVNVVESTQIARGWSVKKTLLGKVVYNDVGEQVGKVEDLIIAPDRNISYVIVGAGGFVGIGRHNVAIPIIRIQTKAGRLVMPGATKDTIRGLPEFAYTDDTTRRDEFIAAADKDIATGKAAVRRLEMRANGAAADAKARLERDLATLRSDVKSAEMKLAEMSQASQVRWEEFEADVSAATSRLRLSVDKALR